MRLGPGGGRVKDQFRAGNVAAFTTKGSAHKKCMQSREQLGVNIIGSWAKPMGKRAAVQGRPFALVHALSANAHHKTCTQNACTHTGY